MNRFAIRKISGLAFALVAFMTWHAPASAVALLWDGSTDDNWFDLTNWTPAQLPNGADDTTIDNGDTVNAGATIQVRDLNVGLRSGVGALPPGIGTLNVTDGFVVTLNDLLVGVSNTGGFVGQASSNGSLTTSGAGIPDAAWRSPTTCRWAILFWGQVRDRNRQRRYSRWASNWLGRRFKRRAHESQRRR